MRKIAILCLLLVGALPALAGSYRPDEIPNVQRMDRRRYVSNPDGILSAGAVARIDSLCASLRERGLAQVAVVVVDDIEGGDAFSFAVELFRSWGVGSAESDNGLGILLVKELREIRFVTGGGLEGILPDALCKRIQLNYMLPAFREGDYSAGMVAGVEAAAAVLEGGEADLSGDGGELPAWMIFVIVVGFIVGPLGLVLAVYYARRRCPKCHKYTLRQDSQRVLSVTHNYRLVEYTYVCPNCGAVVKRQARNLRDDNFGGGAGGGTIIGLSKLMLNTSDIDKIQELALGGQVGHIDLRVGDISEKPLPGLNLEVTASNFGKASSRASCEDKAAGIVHMVIESICQTAALISQGTNMKDFILIGALTNFPECEAVCGMIKTLFPDLNFYVPKDGEYGTAIGTALAEKCCLKHIAG